MARSSHKTFVVMNAHNRVFVTRFFSAPRLRLVACACGLAMLNNCAGANPFSTAAVDKSSPIASEVKAKARASRTYPRFADIPPVPTDARPVAAWGPAASDTAAAGQRLEEATAPSTWSLNDTATFATRAQGSTTDQGASGNATSADTEAFARQLRQRATPPPPPKR